MSKISELNYLAVGKNGSYSDSGTYQSSPHQVTQIAQFIVDNNIQELNIYFHGGLVSENSADTSIKKVMAALDNRGVANTHNLGFIWKTDLLSTLRDNIGDIFNSKFGKSLLKWVIRAVSKKITIDSTKSPGMGTGLSIEEIGQEILNAEKNGVPIYDALSVSFSNKAKGAGNEIDEDDEELITAIAAEIEAAYQNEDDPFDAWGVAPNKVQSDPQIADTFQTTAPKSKGLFSGIKIAKAVVKVAARVIKRYIKDTEHGLHATVVEEICRAYFLSDIGQWVWGGMKNKGEEMWTNDGKVGFDFINELQQKSPGITLNLIGHSAGSICISELLNNKRANNWNVAFNKIVWWAPACTCELFKQALIDHQDEFNDFRMYTMDDNFERDDALVGDVSWLYPSSLLYFISGVLESEADYPIAGMSRYQSAQPPYTGDLFEHIKLFLQPDGRRVLSKTESGAQSGFRSHAIEHGSFDDDEETLKSLTKYFT